MEGSFALWPLAGVGRRVRLNFRTATAGEVRVEALSGGKPLPGRTFDDCDPLTGDDLDRDVSWRGRADLGHDPGAPVELCFRLRQADLFAVELS